METMPARPILLLDTPDFRKREKPSPRAMRGPRVPGQRRQSERFGQRFKRLGKILDSTNPQLELRSDPNSIAPDRALVFEVAGSVDDFARLAKAVGFSYLGELEDEVDPDEDFYLEKSRQKDGKSITEVSEERVATTLYLVMPDLQAMRELVSLWKIYDSGENFPWGKGSWKKLFDHLYDIRPWGPRERLSEGFLRVLDEWIENGATGPFQFEIDLWFSNSSVQRQEARQAVLHIILELNGELLDECVIEAIRYHGLLAQIPPGSFSNLESAKDIGLAFLDQIMFLNPQAMAVFEATEAVGHVGAIPELGQNDPVAALLDGFPLENHDLLAGRLDVDDFLGLEGLCPASRRKHGTAMASLILHGDLNGNGQGPIRSRLLSLPILQPDTAQQDRERTPPQKLAVDVVYRAVRRIKEGEAGDIPLAPEVVIINHSLADPNSPYSQRISAWARLLDYLSFRYGILFIVSAGNHPDHLPIPDFNNGSTFENAGPEERRDAYLKALAMDMKNRQVLAPGEALNPLTVGAWHKDSFSSTPLPAYFIDVLPGQEGPSIITSIGLGHRRTIKPDLFYDGGRYLARSMPRGNCCHLQPAHNTSLFSGQKVAVASGRGVTNGTANIGGTSNAAALVTRKAVHIHEMLNVLAENIPEADVPLGYRAVLIKALLAHGCEWGTLGEHLETIIEPQDGKKWAARRTNIARMLGLGRPNVERVLDCTSQRATLIGWNTLGVDHAHRFRLPLPHSLSGQSDWRRMTVTLAWMTPVNPRHQQYRQAVLGIKLTGDECGTERKAVLQPPAYAVERGTLVHNIYEGERATQLNEDLFIEVECKQQAGHLDDDVPYALAISFEVAVESQIDVYNEVRTKLAVQPRTPIKVT